MSSTTTAARTYAIDPSHSHAQFSVRHLMISKVRGAFRKLSGTIDLPASGPIPSAVHVVVDAESIDTSEQQRDQHLKSPDFFDAATYPTLEFASTAIAAVGTESFEATGNLTIHGVTKPMTVLVNVEGQGKDPWGNERIAYATAFKISRKDFGLTWNQALETGGVAVGDEITITLDVETVPKA